MPSKHPEEPLRKSAFCMGYGRAEARPLQIKLKMRHYPELSFRAKQTQWNRVPGC